MMRKYKKLLEYSSISDGYDHMKKSNHDQHYVDGDSLYFSYSSKKEGGDCSLNKNDNNFEEWLEFMEAKALDAFKSKEANIDTLSCIKDIEVSFTNKYNDCRFDYLSQISNQVESLNTGVNLASLFNSIKFTHEIPLSYLSESCYFIDMDSLNINMSLISRHHRLDITFKENGEVNFSYIDREDGRIRINGSSFFGIGRNRNETKKIIKLFKLSSR